jgi:hypothetical protein
MNKAFFVLLTIFLILALASAGKRRPVKEMSIARKKASKS